MTAFQDIDSSKHNREPSSFYNTNKVDRHNNTNGKSKSQRKKIISNKPKMQRYEKLLEDILFKPI